MTGVAANPRYASAANLPFLSGMYRGMSDINATTRQKRGMNVGECARKPSKMVPYVECLSPGDSGMHARRNYQLSLFYSPDLYLAL